MDPFPQSLKNPKRILKVPPVRRRLPESYMLMYENHSMLQLAEWTMYSLKIVSDQSAQLLALGDEENEVLTDRMMASLEIVEARMHKLRNVLKERSIWIQVLETLKKLEALQDERDVVVKKLRKMGCEVYFRKEENRQEKMQ